MGEPKHRRPRRSRGFRLWGRRGRRRKTLEETPPSRDELAREADRAAAARARRRIVAAAVGALAIVGAVVGVTLWIFTPGEGSAPDPGDVAAEGSGVVVAVTDHRSQAVSVAYLAVHPDRSPQLVLFPPALLTTIPGFGEGTIARASDFGGADLVALTVMNLLGTRVDGAALLPVSSVEEFLEAPLEVDLSRPLIVEEDGSEVVRVAEGSEARDPASVALLISEQGTGDQLAWLQRQGDVWRALAGVMGDRPEEVRRLVSAPSVADSLVAAGRHPELLVTAVPVSRIPVGGGTEHYQLSGEEAAAFAADRLSFLELRTPPRPRVEILNGNGRVGTTRAVAQAVIREGFRVVKTDNADHFEYQTSMVISHGRQHQEEAVRVLELLGRGELVLELRRPSGVVDLTIIVGQDIPSEEA